MRHVATSCIVSSVNLHVLCCGSLPPAPPSHSRCPMCPSRVLVYCKPLLVNCKVGVCHLCILMCCARRAGVGHAAAEWPHSAGRHAAQRPRARARVGEHRQPFFLLRPLVPLPLPLPLSLSLSLPLPVLVQSQLTPAVRQAAGRATSCPPVLLATRTRTHVHSFAPCCARRTSSVWWNAKSA